MVFPQSPCATNCRKNTRHVFAVITCFLNFTLVKVNWMTRTNSKEHRCDIPPMGLFKHREEPSLYILKIAPTVSRLGDENMHIFQGVLCVNRWPLPTVSVINWEIKVSWPLRSLVKKRQKVLDILEQESTILPRQCVIVIGVSLNKTVLSGEDVILIRWNDSALPLKEERTCQSLTYLMIWDLRG